jgi:hypothetical protein
MRLSALAGRWGPEGEQGGLGSMWAAEPQPNAKTMGQPSESVHQLVEIHGKSHKKKRVNPHFDHP